MKKLVIILIILLSLLLIILIGGGIYAYITLKPFLISSADSNQNSNSSVTEVIDKHPLLTPSQESTLEKIGIDPAKLPTTITPAMEACFIDKLGTSRVEQIKAGEAPNAIDLFKAKSCIE